MKWIYLSPHFDDVILSCGGLVWEQVQSGQQVEIWTICAGGPLPGTPLSDFAQQLHARWQTGPEAVDARRREDDAAGQVLGAVMRYWDLPDCIYRRLPDGSFLVNGEEDLWQGVHPQEVGVVAALGQWLESALLPDDQLICPMTLGGHVDHHLVRTAVERLGRRHAFYADYPYAVQYPEELEKTVIPAWQKECFSVSQGAVTAWQQAVAEYASQISTFWGGLEEMREDIAAYWQAGGGTCLWLP